MKVVEIEIAKLKPYKLNAKTHPESQIKGLAESIRRFGFTQPVVVDKNSEIIIGHGRLEAAKQAGLAKVPTVVLDSLNPAEVKALRLLDNRIAETGWDREMLSLDMAELDFDFEPFGVEFGSLLPEPEVVGITDPDEVPQPPVDPVAKLGDLWILGDHKLLCGDSIDSKSIKKIFGDEIAELCFTSPPYSDQREYNGGKELRVEHISKFISAAAPQCNYFSVNLGLSRKNGEIMPYWDAYIKQAKDCGLKLLSWNVWDKTECGSVGNQTAMFGISHEWIFVFGKEPKKLNRTVENKSVGELANHNGNRQADGSVKKQKSRIVGDFSQLKTVLTLTAQKARDDIDHPARFPVEFPVSYIEAMTNIGQIVFEPFGGSGTTLISCEKLGRSCRIIELDPKYCDVIIKRWEDFTGKKAVLSKEKSA